MSVEDEGIDGGCEDIVDDAGGDGRLEEQFTRDAQRLANGELSEDEFRERYSEVLDALEREDGAMPEPFQEVKEDLDDVGIVQALKGFDTEVERRETMKKLAAGAAALGLGAWATAENRQEPNPPAAAGHTRGPGDEGTRWGMVIDLDRCDGCLNCLMGCKTEHSWGPGENWMYVFSWLDEEMEKELGHDAEISQEEANFLVRPCQHCNDPPCTYVCPTTARHQREDGIVLTDYDVCIGCRYCQVGCPYGVNYFGWGDPEVPEEDLPTVDYTSEELRAMDAEERRQILEDSGDRVHDARGRRVTSRPPKGTMGKCTFNVHRQDGNRGEEMAETTACMEWCDSAGMSAIHFGDLNDPESRPNQYLRHRREVAESQHPGDVDEEEPAWKSSQTTGGESPPGKTSEFRLLENMGTDPSVIYVGDEPGPKAHQVDQERVEHAATYESAGTVDRRSEVLNMGADANRGDE